MNCRLSLLIFCILLACGCATSTTLISVVNPTYRGIQYNTIIVSAPYDDLITKTYVENLFRSALSCPETKVFRSIDVLPPLRQYTMSEVRDTLRVLGAQAILVVGVTDFWSTFYTTPGRSETTVARAKDKTVTRYFPGVTLSQANAKLDVRL